MKKNFLIAVALTVVAFFVATEIAIAADISFSGKIRSRYEYRDQDFNDDTDGDDIIATQVRLNAHANINESTSAFIQMQSTKIWGEDVSTLGGTTTPGGGDASFTPSDADASVGLHEAYFTMKNFASLPADLKFGRQQVVLDGHRLFGHTGWTTGAQTHDAIRLTHKGGNHTLSYVYILANEAGDAGSVNDEDVHVVHANIQGILGGSLSVIFAGAIDGCGSTVTGTVTTCTASANDIYTIGVRQAGQLFGFDYRGEYYHQWGDARADATGQASLNFTTLANQATIDRDAYMFGVRLGKKFNNVGMKPSLTIWYDQLSGTDDSDVTSNTWGGFNTLFDTGHKFYGHMDLFLNSVNTGTAGLGLTDLAVKASLQPMPGWKIKAAWHKFETETLTNRARGLGSGSYDDDIGQEVDLQLIHKYNANTVISAGYSVFTGEELFNLQRGTQEDADWAYIQFDVKF